MVIRGVELVGASSDLRDIVVAGDAIADVLSAGSSAPGTAAAPALRFDGALAFPGLVNSHDHLEFNLHRPLRSGRYQDTESWAADIHGRFPEEIAQTEAVPRATRFRWGALKNLVCGVTAVAHHGTSAGDPAPFQLELMPGTSIHSVAFEPRWRLVLNHPLAHAPIVVHLGEGLAARCHREIDAFRRWNIWRRKVIAVHAIAMTAAQARSFQAVVWCPMSNEFLFGQTAPIADLKARTQILFGTDSTLTGGWSFWEHLRRARELGGLSDAELFAAVTTSAASAWNRRRAGRLRPGFAADVIVARKPAPAAWDAFFAIDAQDVLLVMRRGRVLLVDAAVDGADRIGCGHRVRVNGRLKLLHEDVSGLLKEIAEHRLSPNLPIEAVAS